MHRRPRLIPVGLICLLLAAGCARSVRTDAAPSATDVECAQVLVNLPEVLGERQRREVTAQATAAWAAGEGTADAVVLRCGIEPPAPSTDPCTTVAGVDWLVDEADDSIRYRTYGRVPAAEVLIPGDAQDGVDLVLAGVANGVGTLPVIGECS